MTKMKSIISSTWLLVIPEINRPSNNTPNTNIKPFLVAKLEITFKIVKILLGNGMAETEHR